MSHGPPVPDKDCHVHRPEHSTISRHDERDITTGISAQEPVEACQAEGKHQSQHRRDHHQHVHNQTHHPYHSAQIPALPPDTESDRLHSNQTGKGREHRHHAPSHRHETHRAERQHHHPGQSESNGGHMHHQNHYHPSTPIADSHNTHSHQNPTPQLDSTTVPLYPPASHAAQPRVRSLHPESSFNTAEPLLPLSPTHPNLDAAQNRQSASSPLARSIFAFKHKPTLARTWERQSYLDDMRSRSAPLEHDLEQGVERVVESPRTRSFYASPADMAMFRSLPPLSAPSSPQLS